MTSTYIGMGNHFSNSELAELQALPLEHKVTRSLERIEQYLKDMGGRAAVSFSGGKDSTVLLDLARRVDSTIPGVFANTGLEYPEVVQFVKSVENVVIVKPKRSFRKVIEEEGYPVVSKKVSQQLCRFQNPTGQNYVSRKKCLDKRYGHTFYLAARWRFLRNAPFKISAKCCDILKKGPLKEYAKESGRLPIVGVMAAEGGPREMSYLKYGCFLTGKNPQLRPMGFWTDDDVWKYIRSRGVEYSSIYDRGVLRTGCMFCLFGVHIAERPNRFELMKASHPAQYAYCLDKLKFRDVLTFLGVPF